MTNILERIESTKREEIAAAKVKLPESEIKEMVKDALPVRNFHQALKKRVDSGQFALIAELKKASPSKGMIREEFDPISIARAYELGGADCLSILTDKQYFHGSSKFLQQARSATSLPVLRKDFMYEPYQVYEARTWNADCILIILAAVSDYQAKILEETALNLEMGVLLEVHNEAELHRAMQMHTPLIGINNRDLTTFDTNMETCEKLAPICDNDRLLVGESGISSNQDLLRLSKVGINAFLVGESLMIKNDVKSATKSLLNRRVTSG